MEKIIVPEIRDPNGFDNHVIYSIYIKAFNSHYLGVVEDYLADQSIFDGLRATLNLHNNSAREFNVGITVVGSDGRSEKGALSQLELALISDAPKRLLEDNETLLKIHETTIKTRKALSSLLQDLVDIEMPDALLTAVQFLRSTGVIKPQVEVKSLFNDSVYRYGGNGAIWPSRILDSVPLKVSSSSEEMQLLSKRKLVQEVQGEDHHTIVKGLKKRFDDYKRVARTGFQKFKEKKIKHYNLDSGMMFYNPPQNIGGFKYGPLRLIQSVIELKCIDVIHKLSSTDACAFVTNLPTNTSEKTSYLESYNQGLASIKAQQDLVSHYLYFLWQYHRAEYAFLTSEEVMVPFDSVEAKSRIEDVEKIVISALK